MPDDNSSLSNVDFIVDKSAWHKTQFVENTVSSQLAPGQVLFRVDRFAFTANNISYAGAGDLLKYWNFFPTSEGWGRLPTMGFGDVIASSYEGVTIGTRCFGFYPMSQYLLIEPSSATATSIMDGVAHRVGLAPAYNQYQPVDKDPTYSPEFEDELMLTRGLFLTSFLADDFLTESEHYGASTVLISSASSKTSIALAYRISERGQVKSIGLTSAGNLDFVESLGLYDRVATYDAIGSLPSDEPSVFVDMAGNTKLSREIHETFGSNLKYSMRIGATHWDAGGDDGELPGPNREFFFAPSQIQKRVTEWGPEVFQDRLGASLLSFLESTRSWLSVERGYGRDAVEKIYQATLAGSAPPNQGNVLSLWDDAKAASG
ncbi:MAG: DUF2855 family protein, partial [Deltaproteobacteria bacterium]|nr:DUF2855 family protein [Deltaproteobacteria bacterium]